MSDKARIEVSIYCAGHILPDEWIAVLVIPGESYLSNRFHFFSWSRERAIRRARRKYDRFMHGQLSIHNSLSVIELST